MPNSRSLRRQQCSWCNVWRPSSKGNVFFEGNRILKAIGYRVCKISEAHAHCNISRWNSSEIQNCSNLNVDDDCTNMVHQQNLACRYWTRMRRLEFSMYKLYQDQKQELLDRDVSQIKIFRASGYFWMQIEMTENTIKCSEDFFFMVDGGWGGGGSPPDISLISALN